MNLKTKTMFGLRVATATDAEVLSKLASETFLDSWGQHNSEEDMQHFIKQHFSVDLLSEQIKSDDCVFLIASSDPDDVAYLKLKKGNPQKQIISENAGEVEKLYVQKAFQSQGAGMLLLHLAEAFAIEKGFDVLWLSVWKPNLRAMSFYTRMGFEICGEQNFILGNDVQEDYLMKKHL